MHKGDTNHVVHNDTTCFHTRCPHEFASINPWRKHLLTQPMCLKYFAKLSMLMPSSIRSEWTQTTLLCYKDIWQTMDMDIDGMCFEGTNGWTKFHSRFRVNERATKPQLQSFQRCTDGVVGDGGVNFLEPMSYEKVLRLWWMVAASVALTENRNLKYIYIYIYICRTDESCGKTMALPRKKRESVTVACGRQWSYGVDVVSDSLTAVRLYWRGGRP